MLSRLGFVFAGTLDIRDQRDVHEQTVLTANFQRHLADRFQKRLTFNIAGSAADFGDDHVCIGLFAHSVDKIFDFIVICGIT